LGCFGGKWRCSQIQKTNREVGMSAELVTRNDILMEAPKFDQLWRVATAFSKSQMVPAHFRGKTEDCFVCLQAAIQLDIPPLLALQNTYVVNGRPGFSAQLAIALANRSGRFKGPIRFETAGSGDALAVTARATAQTGEEFSYTVSMDMARKEGWTKNTKYQTMPEHMLRYRAATFLIRQTVPEVLLGMRTLEEAEELAPARIAATETSAAKLTSVLDVEAVDDAPVSDAQTAL
jgi:hypothetical protein